LDEIEVMKIEIDRSTNSDRPAAKPRNIDPIDRFRACVASVPTRVVPGISGCDIGMDQEMVFALDCSIQAE